MNRRRRVILKPTAALTGESPQPNPVIVRLMQRMEKDSQERSWWMEANKPGQAETPTYLASESLSIPVLTWNYLNKRHNFKPGADTKLQDYEVEAVNQHARQVTNFLQESATRGNQEALESLVDLVTTATEVLNKIATEAPARVRNVARHRFLWPFVKAREERFGDDHKRLVDAIDLGGAVPFSESAVGRVRPGNEMVRLTMKLLSRLERVRIRPQFSFRPEPEPEWETLARDLKPFSPDSWFEWYKAAWRVLLVEHEQHPERDPELRKLGAYREKHDEAQRTASTKGTSEANIRDGIREKLRQAVKRFSKNPK